jgi:hypothetical protein
MLKWPVRHFDWWVGLVRRFIACCGLGSFPVICFWLMVANHLFEWAKADSGALVAGCH